MPIARTAMPAGQPNALADLASHFFYLLAEGAVVPKGFGPGSAANLTPEALVGNGNIKLRGIGRAKAFGIWHHAMTAHFMATSSLSSAGVTFLSSARVLYGDKSVEYRAVKAAWSAIEPVAAARST